MSSPLLALLVALMSPPAAALDLRAGAQLALQQDLPDPGAADPPAALGPGPALSVPLWLAPWSGGPALRAELGASTARGWGRLDQDDARPIDLRSNAVWLSLGPQVHVPLPPGSPVTPYFGAAVGAVAVGSRLPESAGLDGQTGPLVTRQLRPRVSGWLGLSVLVSERVAVGIEAGYSTSRVPAHPLPGLEGTLRAAYGLNPQSLGLTVSTPLPTRPRTPPEVSP